MEIMLIFGKPTPLVEDVLLTNMNLLKNLFTVQTTGSYKHCGTGIKRSMLILCFDLCPILKISAILDFCSMKLVDPTS
jgi:hypothetical protein